MRSRPMPQVQSRVKDAEKLQQDEPIVEEEQPMKASIKAPPIIPASTEQQSSLSEIEDVGEGIRIIRKQSSGGIVIKRQYITIRMRRIVKQYSLLKKNLLSIHHI